ncbi:MAG: pilin [Patescibacteria group bacterium]
MNIKKFPILPVAFLIVFYLLIPPTTFGISCPDGSFVPDGKSCPPTTSINPTPAGKGGLGETPVSQNSQSNQKISISNPLGVSTFADLIAKINRWLIIIGAPILTLMILIGAFQIMFAGSTPDKVTEGRHTITYAIIGYGLLLISTGIAYIIKDILGVG